MNLLIVDDEVVAIKGILNGVHWERCGIDGAIWTACSAEHALRIVEAQQVDILLCDIEMPGNDGLMLLRSIRNMGKDLSCIFLTCHASFEYAQEAISLGCRDYILKPAPYEMIEEKLKKLCNELAENRKLREQAKYFVERNTEKRSESENSNRSPKEIVSEVEQYIREHISDSELLVTEIAEAVYLNKDYLNRVFKKFHGISVSQYMIQERMKLAGVLLMDENNTIHRVAEKSGYNNYPYFASSFKRYYGCTPSQYQKEHQKERE